MLKQKQMIELACIKAGITQSELAKRIGMTPSNFSYRINNPGFKIQEFEKMAEALGLEFTYAFTAKS